jgi:hypothetical protein
MTAQSDRTIRMLVVNHHQVVCQGVSWFLNGKPDPEDVGEAPAASRRWTSAHGSPPRA